MNLWNSPSVEAGSIQGLKRAFEDNELVEYEFVEFPFGRSREHPRFKKGHLKTMNPWNMNLWNSPSFEAGSIRESVALKQDIFTATFLGIWG